MLKAISAVAAAAVVAAAFVTFLSFSAQVEAGVPNVRNDRADARLIGGDCSERAWPYFEAGCLRDMRNPYGQARPARVVSTDRLPAKRTAVQR